MVILLLLRSTACFVFILVCVASMSKLFYTKFNFSDWWKNILICYVDNEQHFVQSTYIGNKMNYVQG